MCRKMIYLVSFVVVFGFVNVNNAADIVWTGRGADNLWSTPANWEGNKVPTAADDALIEVPGAIPPNGPVIQDGIDAECAVLWNEVAGEPTMRMTGGTFTIAGWGIWWGDGPGCNPTFYQSGGTITLTGSPGIHELGWGGASGTWIMTGGTMNAKGISIPSGPGNFGTILLHGGTYNVGTERGGLVMREGGLIDITEGTMIFEGDETAKINDLIAAGQITSYDGGGLFQLDYDVRNPGKTTLTAIVAGKAYNPDPADGAIYEDTWANLSWSPSADAVSHDVYFSDNFDDVNDGTGDAFRGNQTTTYFVVGFPGFPYPEGLVPGTTYYWRIDEVEADGTTKRGDIWSFSIPPRTAYNPNPADGAEFVDPNAELSWSAGFGAILHTVYLGDDFDQVDNATEGVRQGATTYAPTNPLESEKVYYWRVDEFDTVDTYKGDIWSFTTPGAVGNPSPANGAVDVKMIATLSWTASSSATSHEVYFGPDKEAVRNADKTSPEYKGSKSLGDESYDPGKLAWYTTYYWRIDEVDSQSNTLKGPLWSFTTADFLSVDDFEDYTDNDAAGEAIWQTWIDGYEAPENGSQAGYLDPPYTEQTIVHGGRQSMPLLYENAPGAATYSEATLPLSYPRDWTENGVSALVIWFQGKADNAAEPLYVVVANSGGVPVIVAHDDASAAQADSWTKWVIQLQTFADQGIDLTNVDQITIGLGSKSGLTTAGGTGTIYFDDIALYPPASPKVPEGLVGLWNFDEGSGTVAVDSSGNGLDGTISGATWVSPGVDGTGSCLDFDGQGTNRVSLGTFDVTGNAMSIVCWYKADNLDTPGNDPRLVSKAIGGNSQDHWFMVSSSRVGSIKVLRFRLKTDGDTGELKADTATGNIELDVWTHAAAVWDGATMRLYKNGVEVGSIAKGGTLSTDPTVKVSIGNQPAETGDRPWDGLIDDVRIYSRALSEAEIQAIVNE